MTRDIDLTTRRPHIYKSHIMEALALALHETLDQLAAVIAQRDDWQRKAERYQAALQRYGWHDSECTAFLRYDPPAPCRCGFDAALADAAERQEGETE